MKWLEASILTTSENVDTVCDILIANGVVGMTIDDDYGVKMYLEDNPSHWDYADENLLNAEKGTASVKFYTSENDADIISLIQAEIGNLEISVKTVDDEDWLDNWKQYFKPFKIGNNIVIKPVWEDLNIDVSENDVVFEINPGSVFGTGLHQSTRLCVEQIEKSVHGGEKVIDIGCGSGILSVISLLLGAESALATDIDGACVLSARENAEINGIGEDRYKILIGDIISDSSLLAEATDKKYDIVLANIVADIIIRLLPLVPKLVKPGGVFISSGIIKERADDVVKAYLENGFSKPEKSIQDEWVCLSAKLL